MALYVLVMSLIALINGQLQAPYIRGMPQKMSQNQMVLYVHIMSLIVLINGQLQAPYIRGMPPNKSKSNGTLCSYHVLDSSN